MQIRHSIKDMQQSGEMTNRLVAEVPPHRASSGLCRGGFGRVSRLGDQPVNVSILAYCKAIGRWQMKGLQQPQRDPALPRIEGAF